MGISWELMGFFHGKKIGGNINGNLMNWKFCMKSPDIIGDRRGNFPGNINMFFFGIMTRSQNPVFTPFVHINSWGL